VCEPSYAAPELGGSWRSRAAAPRTWARPARSAAAPAAPRPQVAKSWVSYNSYQI